MSNISFIYFDLDDTILDHSRAERAALASTVNDFSSAFDGHDIDEVLQAYHEINIVLWRNYGLGKITKAELQNSRFAMLLESFNITSLQPTDVGDTYLSHYPNYWHYCPGADSEFHALADRYQVGLITNGFERTQQKKLNAFPDMRDRLATTIISETVGFLKPDPRLFAHAVEEAGVPPSEILYVGDSYESDVKGAVAAGWKVAWYLRDESRLQDTDAYVFDNWKDFDLSRV